MPCIALLLAISGCSGSNERVSPPATQPAPTLSQQQLDEQVIEAALLDIATGSDEDGQMLRREQHAGSILFSNACQDKVANLPNAIGDAQSRAWKSLSSADRAAAAEGAKRVVTRIETAQLFARFHPKDPRINLWEDNPASTQPVVPFAGFDRPRPLWAAPPGYSSDRSLAVVDIGFPWSIHSGDIVFVLRFDGSNWQVVSRHYLYYA